MKISKFLTFLGITTIAVSVGELMIMDKPAYAQNCPLYNSRVVQRVRRRRPPIGNLFIMNNYGPDPQSGSVSIRLYHSDAPNRVFGTYNFAGNQSAEIYSGNKKLVLGGDWGIQIVFGNGVTSCISPIADIGSFDNGRYVIYATDIYDK